MTEAPGSSDQPAKGVAGFFARWRGAILVASLGLNLAVVGLVAGLAMKDASERRDGDAGLWRYGAELPQPYRRDLAQALRDDRSGWDATRQAFREGRAAFAAAVTAEPFDLAAASAALERERALLSELGARGADALLQQVERMSPEERRGYAARLMERQGRPPDRRR